MINRITCAPGNARNAILETQKRAEIDENDQANPHPKRCKSRDSHGNGLVTNIPTLCSTRMKYPSHQTKDSFKTQNEIHDDHIDYARIFFFFFTIIIITLMNTIVWL